MIIEADKSQVSHWQDGDTAELIIQPQFKSEGLRTREADSVSSSLKVRRLETQESNVY